MSMRYLGGFITASYNPLKVPNAPTIGTATAGSTSASVTFTAPSNVGGGAITSYIAAATKTSDGTVVTATGTSSPITITGLTDGVAYTIKVCAVNTYGPSAYSTPSGSVTPMSPKLFTWGDGTDGFTGQNDTVSRSSPVQVGALVNWNAISAGYRTMISTKMDGTLWAWGLNSAGELGLNDRVSRSSPVQVGALTNWSTSSISASIKTDGTLWTWGSNNYGQLGQNDRVYRSSPTQVGTNTNWSNIIMSNCAIAIKTDGTLWSWGDNSQGQLGQNDRINRSSPVQIGALTTWSKVANGGGSALMAIKTDGTLWSWGANTQGQLGQSDTIYRSSPTQVGALTTWSTISGNDQYMIAIKTDGTMWSCGNNINYVLGLGNSVNRRSVMTQVGSDTDWYKISCGSQSVIATKTTGTLWSWGKGGDGKLGRNNSLNTYVPTQIGSSTNWINPAAGTSASAATSS